MLPCGGNVDHFTKAVDSVLAQSHRDFRLIVVGGGRSGSEPERYAREVAARDSRVGYVEDPDYDDDADAYRTCVGLVTAGAAGASIVVIMGADDIMLPNYLQVVADGFAAVPDAAVMAVGVSVIDERGAAARGLGDTVKAFTAPKTDGRTVLHGEKLVTSLMHGNWTYSSSLAWSSEWIKRIGLRQGLGSARELALLVDVITGGGHMVYDPTLAFLYRRTQAAVDGSARGFAGGSADESVRGSASTGDGDRFDEEARFFAGEAEAFGARGWKNAERAARLHVTSRLSALSQLPSAAKAGKLAENGKRLLGHTFRKF